ncbi:MAG TPA: FMN-binding negative transcriptional regulator [Polyangia bacterium]|nr:FMN-binding negative transcriptional regulator [Polyangia bacterium]
MYLPASFTETDLDKLMDLVGRFPFATVVTPEPGGELWVSHVPLLAHRREGGVVLSGHFARANQHWRALAAGAPTTAIFRGPHAYVSPTWYVKRPAVPTWNYVAVHAAGPVRVVEEQARLAEMVRELAERFEGRGPAAWHPDQVPADFLGTQLAAIVGFELAVERWEGKVKVNQNRSAEDRAGVIARYEADGSDDTRALAALMRATLND